MINAETGARFRNEILAVGGSRPALESFIAFRGREPKIDALLRHNGMDCMKCLTDGLPLSADGITPTSELEELYIWRGMSSDGHHIYDTCSGILPTLYQPFRRNRLNRTGSFGSE